MFDGSETLLSTAFKIIQHPTALVNVVHLPSSKVLNGVKCREMWNTYGWGLHLAVSGFLFSQRIYSTILTPYFNSLKFEWVMHLAEDMH